VCEIVVGEREGNAHLEDIGVDGDTIKMEFMEGGYEAFTGFRWLRTESSSGMSLTGR
jgi:hypothetical protein